MRVLKILFAGAALAAGLQAQVSLRGQLAAVGCFWNYTTNLKGLWYGGFSCTGSCSGTNPVAAVADHSANSNTLTAISAAAYDAGLNGIPAFSFNGSSNQYSLAKPIGGGAGSAGDTTWFAVIQLNSTAAEGTIAGSNNHSGELAWWTSSGGKLEGADVAGIVAAGSGSAAQDLSWHKISVNAVNGVSVTFTIDGVSDGSGTLNAGTQFSDTVNAIGSNDSTTFLNAKLLLLAAYSESVSGPNTAIVNSDIACLTGK